ncbi:hypothetical protein BKA81DRAFT_358578 [Phyllosticta paracitricarpa]
MRSWWSRPESLFLASLQPPTPSGLPQAPLAREILALPGTNFFPLPVYPDPTLNSRFARSCSPTTTNIENVSTSSASRVPDHSLKATLTIGSGSNKSAPPPCLLAE